MPAQTYTTSKANILRGAQFFIGSPTGTTDVYTLLGEVVSGSFSGQKVTTADTTNMQSGAYREYLPTQIDAGTLEIVHNRIPGDAGQVAFAAAFVSLVPYDFKVQLPPDAKAGQTTIGDVLTFSGIIVSAGKYDINFDKVPQVSASIQITGPLTLVQGS